MVMIKDKEGIERYPIQKELFVMSNKIWQSINTEDTERWGIFTGARGSGKSLAAQHFAYINDKELDLARICHSKEEFIQAVVNNKKRFVIADEAISIFFSRGSMTKEGRLVAEVSDQIRGNNLCILLCIPKILSLDWMVLDNDNLKFIAYVYESREMIGGKEKILKGNMAIYLNFKGDNRVRKLIDYIRKKRSNPTKFIPKPRPHFMVKGTPMDRKPWYPTGEAAYRKKKESVLEKFLHKKKDVEVLTGLKELRGPKGIDFNLMDALLKANYKLKEIAKKCLCSEMTVLRRKKEITENNKKLGFSIGNEGS